MNPFLKYIRVEVDGEKVVNVANFTPTRKLDLEVGQSKKHHLEFDIRALTPIQVFVDGEEVQRI